MANKIKNSNLDADIVTGATALSEAANTADTVLLHDTSASALKKITVANLTAQAGTGISKSNTTLSVDIDGTDALTSVAGSDTILVFDASSSTLKKMTQANFLNFPTVTSVSPTNALSGDGSGNHTFVITGTGFDSGSLASLINASGSTVTFDSQTVDSDTQITGVVAKSKVPGSGEPFDVRVAAVSGLAGTLDNQINIDAAPEFQDAAGSLGTFNALTAITPITVEAHDPESAGQVGFEIISGSLPGGLSGATTSSGFVISGTPSSVNSSTTSNFTLRANDAASNTSTRAFTITVNPVNYFGDGSDGALDTTP